MVPFDGEDDAPRRQSRRDEPSRRMALSRFRHNAHFYHRYWTRFFSITHPDLSRLIAFIRRTGDPCTLTSLVREVIRSRLRLGPQLTGEASIDVRADTPSVRFWNPAETWTVGDRAIFAVFAPGSGRRYIPRVGSVIRLEGNVVSVSIDGYPQSRTYRMVDSADEAESPVSSGYVEALFQSEDEVLQVDYVMWRYGDTLVEQTLAALYADDRFLHLYPQWYLSALSPLLSSKQVTQLARKLFARTAEPVPFEDLISLIDPPLASGPAGRFGMLRTLLTYSELFQRVGTEPAPRWQLASPPPERWIARHAAYDPETFEVLCVPGEVISREVAERLWACELFRAVVIPASDSASKK